MANATNDFSIERTYRVNVFRQETDERGAITAVVLDDQLSFQVNAKSREAVEFVVTCSLAAQAGVDIMSPDKNGLAKIGDEVRRGILVEIKVVNPSLDSQPGN